MKAFKMIPIVIFTGTLLVQVLGMIVVSMSSTDKLNLFHHAMSFTPH